MEFSNTTTKDGLIQDCEHWTNLGDGIISGDSTLLKRFTSLINIHYAAVLARIQLLSGGDGAEDRNYPDHQFSTFTIVSGQNDYEFLTDEDGNTISDITGVHIMMSGQSDYTPLDKLHLSDRNAQLVMSPNASNTGTPAGYIERGNVVYFDKIPSSGGTGKLFYRLVPSYFTSSDTTKKPGIIDAAHRILSAGASLDWLAVNKSENRVLIQLATAEVTRAEAILDDYTRQRNPSRARMTGAVHSSR